MRRLTAIGILILHLSVFTEMTELLRLPILVEHYFEHQELVPEISFLQFLSMHYKTDVAHDDTDMELPFKSCDHCLTNPIISIAEQPLKLPDPLPECTQQFGSGYISFIPSTGLNEIFQPPRG